MTARPSRNLPTPVTPEAQDRWVGAHVFTGHPLDLVVSTLVPQVVAELRRQGLADRFFFIRHWQGARTCDCGCVSPRRRPNPRYASSSTTTRRRCSATSRRHDR